MICVDYLMGTGRYELRPLECPDTLAAISVVERCCPGFTTSRVADFEVHESATGPVLVRTDGAVWGSGYEYAVTYTLWKRVQA